MQLIQLTQDDWGQLMQGQAVVLGKTTVVIEPLGIASLRRIITKIKAIVSSLKDKGVSFEAIDDPGVIEELFAVVLDVAPDLLEEMTKVRKEDISRLPIAKGIELLRVALEVNISSHDELIKNFVALGAMVETLLIGKQDGESLKSSSF